MVVKCCRPENSSRAASSFPSVKLLDTLLQYYLTSPVASAASFLHLATFDPNTRRPELVAIMAAAGAALTSDPALTKLGYAIQECVRVAVIRLVSVLRNQPLIFTMLTSPSGRRTTLWPGIYSYRKHSYLPWR